MRWFAAGVMLVVVASAASAEDKKPPYWASIASGQAMMRTGPGRNYPGTWLYQRRDLPIRVVQVYNHWRKIEDPDGQQGWMLVTMLSDKRSAIIRPGPPRDLHNKPDADSHVAYKAEPGVVGMITKCREGWCKMTIAKREAYVKVSDIWGLSDGESVD
jgi:SH3-like domain-containing protein